jgi:large subunit ribosomal protein L28
LKNVDKSDIEMSNVCEITGKSFMIGNNVSHSKRRTKRRFNPNLFNRKFYLPEEDRWVSLKVSATGLRYINKVGIHAAIKSAKEKGFLRTKI